MRVLWEVDQENRRVYTKHIGRITIVEIAELITDSFKNGTLQFQFIADVTEADVDLFPTDTRHFVDLLAHVANGTLLGKVAVLTSSETAAGLIHMLSQLAMGICPIAAFTDREAAECWLAHEENSSTMEASAQIIR